MASPLQFVSRAIITLACKPPGPPSLGFLLADAARLLGRRFEQESRDLPMTAAQLKIVARLTHNKGIGQAALAAILDLEPMTLSRPSTAWRRRGSSSGGRIRTTAGPEALHRRKSRELLSRCGRAPADLRAGAAGMSDAERQALYAGLEDHHRQPVRRRVAADRRHQPDRARQKGNPHDRPADPQAAQKVTPLGAGEPPAPPPPAARQAGRAAAAAPDRGAAVGAGARRRLLWATGGRYVATEDAYVEQDRVSVVPQVSGQIDAVMVGENETVTAGETLFTIDPASIATSSTRTAPSSSPRGSRWRS